MRYSGFHRAVGYIHNVARAKWPISLSAEVEVDALQQLREQAKSRGVDPPSYTACVTKAIGMALAELSPQYPELNSMIGRFLFFRWISKFDGVSLGVAVSRDEDGLDRVYVMVIQEPAKLSLADLTARLDHASKAPASEIPEYVESRKLYTYPGLVQRLMLYMGSTVKSLHQKHWGTASLTTVGKFGVNIQMGMPLTTPIQFGFGEIKKRPVVRGDKIEAALTVHLTMAFDRRLMNGRPPCQLLSRVQHILSTADDGRWFSPEA